MVIRITVWQKLMQYDAFPAGYLPLLQTSQPWYIVQQKHAFVT